ncbi:hypothetical protein [[Mycobacterium] vasticus]|uniref:DUF222 domain-containing protein n=1 Tax=[Mycobacterium] vasticus TaxID=2875777 RepID=A0ABU5Z504_9MYCO|nr:hypothetical protein [Mycolicibacter sp. MYC017]MEB3071699.1 hypothetical protein [Mycolicibacter sp. MYC017]
MLNPTCPDLLRAIIANMDEVVLPQLEGPHALSAGKNIKLLLAHVIYRLEHEGESLATDNAEKRSVLATLTERAGASELRARLDGIPDAGRYVRVEDLAVEAIRLRELAVDASLYVHHNAATLGAAATAECLGPLRAQLRAQLDRDSAAVSHLSPAEIYDHKGV